MPWPVNLLTLNEFSTLSLCIYLQNQLPGEILSKGCSAIFYRAEHQTSVMESFLVELRNFVPAKIKDSLRNRVLFW